jgi:hypothetical protein
MSQSNADDESSGLPYLCVTRGSVQGSHDIFPGERGRHYFVTAYRSLVKYPLGGAHSGLLLDKAGLRRTGLGEAQYSLSFKNTHLGLHEECGRYMKLRKVWKEKAHMVLLLCQSLNVGKVKSRLTSCRVKSSLI